MQIVKDFNDYYRAIRGRGEKLQTHAETEEKKKAPRKKKDD